MNTLGSEKMTTVLLTNGVSVNKMLVLKVVAKHFFHKKSSLVRWLFCTEQATSQGWSDVPTYWFIYPSLGFNELKMAANHEHDVKNLTDRFADQNKCPTGKSMNVVIPWPNAYFLFSIREHWLTTSCDPEVTTKSLGNQHITLSR